MQWIFTFCLKHRYLLLLFHVQLGPVLGETGEGGAVLGKLVCVTLSISSYTPFIAFQFLLSHQVPEGLRFPIIFLDMGEVVGTDILFHSVTTVKLVHY